MYRHAHRNVLITCLLGVCLAMSMPALAAAGRVQVDQTASRLASLARDLDRRDELQRWTFAVVTLDVLIERYREELRQSATDATRDRKRRQKLARWQAATGALIGQLDSARNRIAEGAPFSLQVDAQQQLLVIVDGQPVAVSGPNPRADRDIATQIMQRYCTAYDCATYAPDARMQDAQSFGQPGSWSFSQNLQPAYETHNGHVRCQFTSLSERAIKARLCTLLGDEIALLRDGLRQARQQGHLIDWPYLQQHAAGQSGRTILRLNPAGAYLEIDTPLLSSLAIDDWRDLIQTIADARSTTVTIDQADRLMVLKGQFR